MTGSPSSAKFLARPEAQKILFADRLNWSDLLTLEFESPAVRRILVLRNHMFESIGTLVNVFAGFGGWKADFSFSEYDDTVSFPFQNNPDFDLILLWLDTSAHSLSSAGQGDWLAGRIERIRELTKAPIVVSLWARDKEGGSLIGGSLAGIPGVFFINLRKVIEDLTGECVENARMHMIAGTPLGRNEQALVAREAGCRWFPSLLFPGIKAVVTDLDGTLHDGVLGEHGVGGVRLTPEHASFQRRLKALKERGIFLALLSRNEEKDVLELFDRRDDYPLRRSDFSAIQIGWDDKAAGISRIAASLRVGADALLMVDDNPGELVSIGSQVPGIKLLWASPDVSANERALEYYPCLWRAEKSREDGLRTQDLSAAAARSETWSQIGNEDDYFRELKVCLTYDANPVRYLERLAELSQKTNQFNLSLCRLGEAQISSALNCRNYEAVAVGLSDRLAESGIIGFVAARLSGDVLCVEEVCVSCRALGRRLEDPIVLLSIRKMKNYEKSSVVSFNFERAPRNEPALAWLRDLSGGSLPAGGSVRIEREKLDSYKFSRAIDFRDS